MRSTQVPAQDREIPAADVPAVRAAAEAAWAQNTRKAYESAWNTFTLWCEQEGRQARPAAEETIILYVTRLANVPRKIRLTYASIEARLSAIRHYHEVAGFRSPTTSAAVRHVVRGVRRKLGVLPLHAKAPATADVLTLLLSTVDRSELGGQRDAALLLLGFAMGARRSEVTAIDVEHLGEIPRGLSILIPRSKTDQDGQGRHVGVAHWHSDEASPEGARLCPVCALAEWLLAAGITSGPVFRGIKRNRSGVRPERLHPQEVALVVKRYAAAAGLDVPMLSAHSLRAGHVTEAYLHKIPEAAIMEQTGHTSIEMLRRYRRIADPIERGTTGTMNPWKTKTDAKKE